MPRLFVQDFSFQLSKDGQTHCGDVITVTRMPHATLAVLADGAGSGISASIEATLVTEYLVGLVRGGETFQEAVNASLRALHSARLNKGPWAAFNAILLSPDGEVQAYSYEAPLPAILTAGGLEQISFRPQLWEGEVVHEAAVHIRAQEAILLVSDGVTQAGLGRGFPRGWGETGLHKYLSETSLARRSRAANIPTAVVHQASALANW